MKAFIPKKLLSEQDPMTASTATPGSTEKIAILAARYAVLLEDVPEREWESFFWDEDRTDHS